jgi:hypothetical protein
MSAELISGLAHGMTMYVGRATILKAASNGVVEVAASDLRLDFVAI